MSITPSCEIFIYCRRRILGVPLACDSESWTRSLPVYAYAAG